MLRTHLRAHKHRHTLTHSGAQTGSGLLLLMPLPAKCSCCFLAPVTVETADCITGAHQRGTAALKEREPSLHPFMCLTSVIAIAPFFFCPLQPPASSSLLLRLSCPHRRRPFSSKTLKKKRLTDLVFHIQLRMSLTPQSTRYYSGLPADLNPNLERRI